MKRSETHAVFALFTIILTPAAAAPDPMIVRQPPVSWHTSWVGNTFGGIGGPNGLGY